MADGSHHVIGLPPGASEETAGEDAKKYGTSNPVVRRLLDRLLHKLQLATSECTGTVVDVGVGEGLALEALGLQAAMLVGVEYRADKLTQAVARVPHLNGVQADAGLLPFRDRSVDLVTCIEVLEHLTAPAVGPVVNCNEDGHALQENGLVPSG
jgi:ubiquinone/menaquinone biosynthesis C-methylase UbiE